MKDSVSRAKAMIASIRRGIKTRHMLIETSTEDFINIQDLYLNSYYEWLKSPIAREILFYCK